ncbi:DUF2798 domain-containing protein [Eubacterium sp. 1001713B170207_170306_E7]|uniref:DUF2798 domain-containing protein n=1 Tax=Eubacterium sp. 1001713B170207_170306_E7 TaxID=2787097 RepID=UPI001898DF9B|nr:DUF2798 domain-containing protein [Eubacterium sp. 1001713B170207_170306_E7]
MFTKKAFGLVLNFWFALFLAIAMSLVMTYANAGFIPFPGILIKILEGLVIGFAAGAILPINSWAVKLALKCGAPEGSIPFKLISTLVNTVYFCTILSFAFTALEIGFPPYFFMAFLAGMPLALASGYLTALLVTPLAVRLADKMTNKPFLESENIK